MGLFDEIGKKIAKSGQDTVKKAKELAELAKLNGQIAEEQRALTAFYAQIGERYYTLHKDCPQDEFIQSCERITAGLKRITDLTAEVQRIKNARICPKCGATCPANVQFCGACGEPLAAPAQAQGDAPTGESADAAGDGQCYCGQDKPQAEQEAAQQAECCADNEQGVQ